MSRRRLFTLLAALLVALAVAVSPAGTAAPRAHASGLEFLGQAIIPTGAQFAGTEVGGLSSITYDASRNVYYVLSDDRSQIDPALFQDGPAATVSNGSPSRLLRYNLQTGRLDREYLYETDRIFEPPVPPSAFAVSGLVELLPLNNEFLLSIERSFSVGVPGTGNEIKLYRVALPGADDIKDLPSLAGLLDSIRPAQKTLLLDLGTLGIPLDNVEGMTFGPRLPDGRQSLVLVSDNNFATSQFTQFLLFAVN